MSVYVCAYDVWRLRILNPAILKTYIGVHVYIVHNINVDAEWSAVRLVAAADPRAHANTPGYS